MASHIDQEGATTANKEEELRVDGVGAAVYDLEDPALDPSCGDPSRSTTSR